MRPFRSQKSGSWGTDILPKVWNNVASGFVLDRYNKPAVFTDGPGSTNLYGIFPNHLKYHKQDVNLVQRFFKMAADGEKTLAKTGSRDLK